MSRRPLGKIGKHGLAPFVKALLWSPLYEILNTQLVATWYYTRQRWLNYDPNSQNAQSHRKAIVAKCHQFNLTHGSYANILFEISTR